MDISEADYIASLDLIQEAALEPAAWEKVLRQLARLTDCVAGALTLEYLHTGEGRPIVYFGFDNSHVQKTFVYNSPLNLPLNTVPRTKRGFNIANGDVVSTDEFWHTGFYNGRARLQDLSGPWTLVLHREESFYCPLTLVRPDGAGEASAKDRSVLKRLVPHLTRALRVSLQVESVRHRLFAMETTLTQIAVAVILLDRQLRVVFANSAGEKLLAVGSELTTVGSALVAGTAASNQQLQKAILEVAMQKRVAGVEISIERKQRRPLLATVLPVGFEDPFVSLVGNGACCAIFVSDPDFAQASRSSAFARLYGLTPTETRLLDSILSGVGLMQAAENTGIRVATARTHLMHIFSKTGTRRQGELINLVMVSTSPLLGRD